MTLNFDRAALHEGSGQKCVFFHQCISMLNSQGNVLSISRNAKHMPSTCQGHIEVAEKLMAKPSDDSLAVNKFRTWSMDSENIRQVGQQSF